MRYWLRVMVSFDVVSLFTFIPVHRAIEIARDNLENDESLDDRTSFTNLQIARVSFKCDIFILQRGVLSIKWNNNGFPGFS